ncbi:SRPBCC family protein [Actinopolyspora sp. H202]|uniref:SRPBCC family protein n=1 Tax=Actinopolyspora sp. H202 TaxID=1500456 RepID=UPI003EE56C79
MAEPEIDTRFELHAAVHVHADPRTVYDTVSDITRMGEWSPENTGGEWLDPPGQPGARFHGHNRGDHRDWTTECEVLEADRPRLFSWGVHGSVNAAETSIWSFEITPTDGGCLLTQRYVMSELRHGLRVQLAELSEQQAALFLARRRSRLEGGMRHTVRAVKRTIEQARGLAAGE